MGIPEQVFQVAIQRGKELRRNGYAVSAEYHACQNCLVVGLNSGVITRIPMHLMQALSKADPAAFNEVEIAPSRLALHWPSLDADVWRAQPHAGHVRHKALDGCTAWAKSDLNKNGSAGSLFSWIAGMSLNIKSTLEQSTLHLLKIILVSSPDPGYSCN